jgi:acyl-CoA synthetase (NDP forming)
MKDPVPRAAHTLSRLFRPNSIALIGASDRNPFSIMAAANLGRFAFAGEVHMVNPRAAPAHGRPAVASCREIGSAVDLAYVCVPQVAVLEALEEAAAAGIRNFVLVSSGFAETGAAGAELQRRLEALIIAHDLQLLGPNSLGFINFKDRIAVGAMVGPFAPLPASIAMISASGSTGIQLASFAYQIGIGLTHLISTGNEAGIDTTSVIDFLLEDPEIKAIGIFAETVRRPVAFTEVAQRAFERRKPLVILKVGRAPSTAALVAAHTGTLVGDDRVFDAVCDRFGIQRVYSTEQLIITAATIANTPPLHRAGVAIVSVSGGACEMIADAAREAGVPVPPFADDTQARLRGIVSDIGQTHNPLDLTGAVMRDPTMWERVLRTIAQDPNIGLTVCNFDIPAAPLPDWQAAWEHIVAGLRAAEPPGPILTSYIQCLTEYGRQFIKDMQIPYVISGIGSGLAALGSAIRWSARLTQAAPVSLATRVRQATPRKFASERDVLEYLAKCGVPVVPATVVRSETEAIQAYRAVGAPVVLKILSPDIQHKTEAGGVLLNLNGETEVAAGFRQLLGAVQKSRPAARLEGALISPMRASGIEIFVGLARDPQWGWVMSLGLGGIWIEALDDTVIEPLPVGAADVIRALRRLRGARLFEGYRGSPPVDLGILADSVVRIGEAALALGPDIAVLEVNPLLVNGDRIEALDALVVSVEAAGYE